jgi:hypothetical protein
MVQVGSKDWSYIKKRFERGLREQAYIRGLIMRGEVRVFHVAETRVGGTD